MTNDNDNGDQETKYSIGDGHEWPDEREEEAKDMPPAAEVDRHTVVILHRAYDAVLEDRDIRYRYVLEDGVAIGILRSHRLAGSNQFDPMGAAAPFEVPQRVRRLLAEELGADHWVDVVDTEKAAAFAEPRP